ncbi:MAG: hypothetical protein RSB38_05020 [Oscillospiraceae bacterium]
MPNFDEIKATAEPTPETCPAVGYQSVSVCVPVTVTPFAETGITRTKCCGDPVIAAGKETCKGIKNGSCAFTISQDICVAIPVAFGATSSVGDTYVNCNEVSAKDICSDCVGAEAGK